ncbi:hypothetical protein [Vibrio aerogenes]|uniref:hypothetical protein n=1 Tax=Vibrio aerogenes TaxID=92172 RepID=UPI0021C42F28|nr:hypothetical protein [Vibrio aerogenes]
MSKEKDKQGKVIWREIVDFFKSSHVTLTGYVLAAMIAAIGGGWLSTELKFLLLGPQSTNEIHRITLVISGLMFVIIMLLSIIPLSEKRAQLSADPKAKNALKQIPSYGRRIALLLTLLLFTLLLDTGKDILQNIAKSAPYWVIIVGMVVLFVLFILALTISPRTSESGVRKLLKYFETPSDMWLAVVIFASGVAIACIPPLSALHYLWFAVLGGYLFLHQVRRHAVPTNMLAETEDVTPHRHLILFVSIFQQQSVHPIKGNLPQDIEELSKIEQFPDDSENDEKQNDFIKSSIVIMKLLFDPAENGGTMSRDFFDRNKIDVQKVQSKINDLSSIRKGSCIFKQIRINENDNPLEITDKNLVQIISRYVWAQRNFGDIDETISLPTFSDLIGVYDATLAYFGAKSARTSWRMLFVALEHHLLASAGRPDNPQIVSLIVSDRGYSEKEQHINQPNDAGSKRQIDSLLKLLSLYLIYNDDGSHQYHLEFHLYKPGHEQPFTRISSETLYNTPIQEKYVNLPEAVDFSEYGANFYDFESCMNAVQDVVTASSVEEWDTVVDFTSGNKVASMVATFMTTTTDVKAQYVDEKYNVKLFDLRYYDLAKLGG